MKKRSKILLGIGFIIFFTLIVFFDQIVNLVTDYQWFSELGFQDVMMKRLITQGQIGIPLFFLGGMFFYYYFHRLKKNYYKKIESYHIGLGEKSLNKIISIPAFFLGYVIANSISATLWFDFLVYRNGQAFNFSDPVFNKDISFYIFQLPFLREILGIMTGLLVLLFFTTIIFYILMFALRRPTLYEAGGKFLLGNRFLNNVIQMALKQLLMVGVSFLLVLAANYYLSAYNILYNRGINRGVIYGASYTDIMVTLKVLRIQLVMTLLAIPSLILGYHRKQLKFALVGPIGLIVLSLLGNVVSASVENFYVTPNQRTTQLPYIEDNIKYTRKAYGLDQVTIKEFDVKDNLTLEDIKNNRETIDNIRINDYRPTLEAYNQLQAIRFYYQFNDVDIDRYYIEGKYTQVFLAARELDINRLDGNAQNWINQHIKYTHGYGVTLSPVNEVTRDGQPKLFIRNIPPVSDIDISIDRPEIYFGELTNQYILVNTKEKEFDYPVGNDNAETFYEGTAGIPLKGINRLLYSYKQGTPKLLLSGSITSESRIVLHRNILERVEKIVPFLSYDEDPYVVISEGKLFWIIDAYTTSSYYPYATPFRRDQTNYIRNSVKVVIDAYNGDVAYYITNENDPIIKTYEKVFPQLFKSMEEMPVGLLEHLRYPQDLFDLQAQVYAMYHMTNPNVFYNQEDIWYLAEEKYYDRQQPVESQYMIMKLPGEEKEEYVLTVAFTPKGLPNMTALLKARNDRDNYGGLIVYRLPKERNVYGPAQVEARIDSDPIISQNLSLWGEGGSTVIRGNLLVIPIEESVLYVEPLYIQASSNNSIPEVKKVIVAFQDRIVMEDTLDLALTKIFGGSRDVMPNEETTQPQPGDIIDTDLTQPLKELIENASQIYEKAKEASQRGEWANYGRYLEELEGLLKQMEKESQKIVQ